MCVCVVDRYGIESCRETREKKFYIRFVSQKVYRKFPDQDLVTKILTSDNEEISLVNVLLIVTMGEEELIWYNVTQ